MKKIALISTLFLILLIFTTSLCANALSSGFSMKEVSQSQQDQILQNLHITYLSTAPQVRSFENFDVSEQGKIVTGSDIFPLKTLCVYDANGQFQYGYTFITPGAYDIEWDGNNILVYTVRGNTAFSLNSSGECVELKKIKEDSENDKYRRTLQTSKKRVGENQYIAKNINTPVLKLLFMMFPYTEIVKIDATGVESIVLDCKPTISTLTLNGVWTGLVVILTAVIVLLAYSRSIKGQSNR